MAPLARGLGKLARRMSFAGAVDRMLDAANINVVMDGQLPDNDGSGLIVASDHTKRLEPLLVQAAMNRAGRDASYVLAMPTSFAGRLMQASGKQGKDLVIPVIPSGHSADNKPSWRRPKDAHRYRQYPNVFGRSKDDLRRINGSALAKAAGLVAAGNTVTICPAGDAGTQEWQAGLGRIVRQLPPSALETTNVAVLRTEGFSPRRVVTALALKAVGLTPKPQTVTLHTAVLGTAEQLYGQLATSDDPAAAQQISDVNRAGYRHSFGVPGSAPDGQRAIIST